MDKISIIIPTFKNEALTIRCLRSVMVYTKIPYEIIWVDDCSPIRSFMEVLAFLSCSRCDFRVLRLRENQGPAVAINQGLKMARSDIIAILNNDAIVTDGWLEKLINSLRGSDDIGVVSAVTDRASSMCRYDRVAERLGLRATEPLERFFNNLDPGTISVKTNISYFCIAIKREVIEKVGYLDERFYMGGEDDDYNDRIRAAGYQTTVCVNCFVYHDHHATLDLIPGIHERRKQNIILLRKKRAQRLREVNA